MKGRGCREASSTSHDPGSVQGDGLNILHQRGECFLGEWFFGDGTMG